LTVGLNASVEHGWIWYLAMLAAAFHVVVFLWWLVK